MFGRQVLQSLIQRNHCFGAIIKYITSVLAQTSSSYLHDSVWMNSSSYKCSASNTCGIYSSLHRHTWSGTIICFSKSTTSQNTPARSNPPAGWWECIRWTWVQRDAQVRKNKCSAYVRTTSGMLKKLQFTTSWSSWNNLNHVLLLLNLFLFN